MINKINPSININNKEHSVLKNTEEKQSNSFSSILTNAINTVNGLEQEADNLSIKMAAGQLDNIHEAMVVTQKAEISMRYLIEVRNKVLDAYREIMRMQI
ncbi:flagellar hook-basal body complex protein FliE [Serpentinicella alkaliphila]|uniref:Flagellar hook-basal body complex protein FliE n=1 Tax=Serpentinicella alkaliphila TaxID=1734049 RepID=A0A4R2UDN5_9FIRM|nr:flagellar hook-basal body complex protein FliE [Serpentinicella alkaliphila]QUH26274.1 flagellar hook-basal body complex protein FliE [Serpentinicella alkaliphila]TCQ05853.1 flagellar hook-basal body complex protein FliE [Serpentinicella alkaliphila]